MTSDCSSGGEGAPGGGGGGERNPGSTSVDDVGVAEPTRKDVEPLSPGCRFLKVRSGGERDSAWVIFFVDDAISIEVQWRDDGARRKALTASLADAHFQVMGERA